MTMDMFWGTMNLIRLIFLDAIASLEFGYERESVRIIKANNRTFNIYILNIDVSNVGILNTH